MCSTFGSYRHLVESFCFIVTLGTHHTILVQSLNALVSGLCQLQICFTLVPYFLGSTDDLLAGTFIHLLILILRHILHCISLLELRPCLGTADTHQRIATLHCLSFDDEEGIHTSRQLARDTDFSRFNLALQYHVSTAHRDDADNGDNDYCCQDDNENSR